MKDLVIFGVIALFSIILAGFLINIIFFPVNTAQKLIDTAYDAQDKVLNADNAIYNYEWFKQKYQDIEAVKKQLLNAQRNQTAYRESLGDRKDWTFEDKTEDSRLNSVVLGLMNNYESQIADYNARASMATRNIFEDNVLPNFIDALTFIRK